MRYLYNPFLWSPSLHIYDVSVSNLQDIKLVIPEGVPLVFHSLGHLLRLHPSSLSLTAPAIFLLSVRSVSISVSPETFIFFVILSNFNSREIPSKESECVSEFLLLLLTHFVTFLT